MTYETKNCRDMRFPWRGIMRLAQLHGIETQAAWTMTPADLFSLFDLDTRQPIKRQDILRLMKQFPDEQDKS